MSDKVKWLAAGGVLVIAFAMTFMRSPQEITNSLALVSSNLAMYSLCMHVAFLAVLAAGLLLPGARTRLFGGFLGLLAASAAGVALYYSIPPNILLFGLYFVLILHALLRGGLGWDLSKTNAADRLFGLIGLIFGFWYLHWVESPLMLNALLYSPMGVVNCPTMMIISGFLCLASRRPSVLEFVSGAVCVFFGLFGIFRLGAYVDVALLACGVYQLARLAITARRGAALEPGGLGKAL
jgi:hypothetical protein